MVYFNGEPYSPTSKKETDQWGRVLEFKENFPKEGLWWPYQGAPEFEKLLRIHLTNFIRAQFPLKQAEAAATAEHPEQTAPTILALHQLPPPPRDFTGREAELKDLMTAVETKGVTISGLRENHAYSVVLFFMHYNSARTHHTLWVTPATEGGVSHHVWRLNRLLRCWIEKLGETRCSGSQNWSDLQELRRKDTGRG